MLLKKILSWTIVVVSSLVGVLGLAYFGLQDVSLAATDKWWASFIAASALFAIVPLLASIFVLLNKRVWAALLFLLTVPIFGRWAFLNANYDVYLAHLYAKFAVVCLVFGLYWLFARLKRWPALISRPWSLQRRVIVFCVTLSVILILDLAATFGIEALPYEPAGDCSLKGVFSRSTFGHDAVFTAHLIRVGHQHMVSDTWVGSWAVARVQERFWGWNFPRVVFLSANGIRDGDDYLVDGRRSRGVLTRYLPIVEIRYCNRSSRLADAGVELRLLRSGFPKSDVRIMGRVIRWVGERPREPYAPQAYILVPGAKVAITGSGVTIITTTDRDGIYDVSGLPPGRYKAEMQDRSDLRPSLAFLDSWSDLRAGDVAEYSFSSQ